MNKYRGIPLEIVVARAARDAEPLDLRLDEGIILNIDPQSISPRGSPELDLVRIEQGALKGDWSTTQLGSGAPATILAQGEHRFIQVSTGELVEVHFRLYKTVLGFARIESYDEATDSWVEEVTGDFEINEVFLSWISYFDAVFFADGDRVFKWDRSELEQDEGNDFPTLNELRFEGDITDVTVTPAGGTADAYTVHFELTVTGPSEEPGTVKFDVLHEGEVVGTRTVLIPANSATDRVIAFDHLTIDFIKEILNTEVVTLRLTEVVGTEIPKVIYTDDPPDTTIDFAKDADERAFDGNYTFHFYTINNEGGGPQNLDFYVDYGSGFVLVASEEFDIGSFSKTINISDDIVGFQIDIPAGGGRSFQDPTGELNRVEWNEIYGVSAHGFNLATDLDITNGITYNTTGDPQNVLVLVYEDLSLGAEVLVGRYLGLGTFANRLILLRKDGDPQKVAICVNEDPTDWLGEGSDETILTSRSDPVDELMAFAPLTANTGALFRKKSIMRVVQTGNVTLPLAYFHWIENIGTESPFSVVIVPGGVCFFGYDKHAYFLAEGMQQPLQLDAHVHEEWELIVPDDGLENVEAYYDPFSTEYVLILPEEE